MAGEHIRAAIARGLPRRRVVGRHVLKNSLVPIVTILGLDLAYLMGGAVITETIFNLPGLGYSLVRGHQDAERTARRRARHACRRSSSCSRTCSWTCSALGSTRGSAMSDLLPPPESEVKPASLTEAIAVPTGGKQLTLWGDVWRKLKRDKRFWVSSGLIAIFALMAIAPFVFLTKDPNVCPITDSRSESEQGALVRHRHPRMRLLHARALRRPHLARGRRDRVQPDDRDLAHARRGGRVLRQVGRHGDLPMGRHLVLGADAARRDPRPDDVQRRRTRPDLPGHRDVRVARHDEAGPLDGDQRETPRLRPRLAHDGVARPQDPPATRAAERHRAGAGLRRLRRRASRSAPRPA